MINTPLLVKERQFVTAVEDTKTFPTNEPISQCIHFSIGEPFQRIFLRRPVRRPEKTIRELGGNTGTVMMSRYVDADSVETENGCLEITGS